MKPEAPKPDPNKELAQRVKQALEGDGKVQAAGIDVTAKDGRVSCGAPPPPPASATAPVRSPRKVDGVASVDNQIKIVKGS